MNCRTCGYSLFNLSSNVCPECGSRFDLRSYKFEPESVAFACPYCEHTYAGHGTNYLPSEADQVQCLNCGQTVATELFRVVPLRPDAHAIDPQRVPWERRELLGFWTAYWQTWKLAALSPARLGEQLGTGQSWMPALGFAALTHALASISSVILWTVVMVAGMRGSGGNWAVNSFNALPLCSGWLFALVCVVIGIAAAHVVLLTGPRREGWDMTARALCYAQAPQLITALPMLGCSALVAWVWYAVVGTVILSIAQRVSQAKAAVAVMWLLVLVVGGLLLLAAVLVGVWVI
jgi:predicted RNA-binding Zn-ribbon protein involved in translation (DUF1610 family)